MKILKKIWPIIFFLGIWLVLLSPFFLKGLLPIPADIIAGVYYPWLDYKWEFPVGVPVKNPLLSDIPSLLYPWRSFAIDQLKLFRIPFWNPYYFTGMPLLANFQAAVFSYVNIFFLFLPKAIAWSLGVMLSPLLTMLAMYYFLRHKNLDKIPSLLGSLVFSLSGFEIAWLEYNVHGHTALFLPLLLLAIDKIFESKGRIWPFLLSVFIAFQIFSGYLPIVIYSYLICFFYILYFYFFPQIKERKLILGKFIIILVFLVWGLALAAVQLFPGYELVINSIRKIDPIVAASNASYLPLRNLSTFIAPDFFGNPATGNYFGQAFYDNFYLFVGTPTLTIIFYSIFLLKKERSIRFWFSILALSLVLIIKNPLGLFLERVLFLSGGVAARAIFITDFSLAVLAALGMEEILKSGENKKNRILTSISLVFFAFLLTGLTSFRIENPVNRFVAQKNLIIPFIFLISSFVVLLGFLRTKSKSLILMFLILTSGQLLYSAKKYLPFSKKELLFPDTPVTDFLRNRANEIKEPFRVELGEVIPQNFLLPYGIETTSGSDALLPRQTGEFLSVLETGSIADKISRVHLIHNYDSSLFSLLNTKYILAKKIDEKGFFSPTGKPPSGFLDPRFRMVFEDKTVQVYEDMKYLPRAFWVYDFEVVKNFSQIQEVLKKTDFSKKIILEEDPSLLVPKEGLEGTKDLFKKNKIEWLENEPGKVILSAESNQPGVVFISNNYYPGWKAYVNGEETKILKANYSFWGIIVPEGKNLLTFLYIPDSFKSGLFITLVALMLGIFTLFLIILRKLIF